MTETIYLVHSGDKNSKYWDYWFYYYNKYYTCNNIDTIFLTENLKKEYNGVKFYLTGDACWSDGLIDFLEKADCKYLIYQHEDYFLTEKTNEILLYQLIDIVKNNNINLLKICGLWAGCPNWKDENAFIDTGISDKYKIQIYNNSNQYLVSHQTSIWSKDFLLSSLKRNETPWGHELNGTLRLRDRNVNIHAYRGKSPLDYAEVVARGEIRKGFEKFFDIKLEM